MPGFGVYSPTQFLLLPLYLISILNSTHTKRLSYPMQHFPQENAAGQDRGAAADVATAAPADSTVLAMVVAAPAVAAADAAAVAAAAAAADAVAAARTPRLRR